MSVDQSINLIMELEKLKAVYRKTKVQVDDNRHENSAEHSWHSSLAAQILYGFADINVDINKVINMLLIHDIAEMYAGDMFAFDDNQQQNQHKKLEHEAINRLFNNFPLESVAKIRQLWFEFEEGATPEAQFALCVDRILPFLQNIHNEGGSWAEFNISKSQILKRNELLQSVSAQLWDYLTTELDRAVAKGWVVDN